MFFDLQKASMLKRVSAFILDGILVLVLATMFGFFVSKICDYDSTYDALMEKKNFYESEYHISTEITAEEYESFDQETRELYDRVSLEMAEDVELSTIYTLLIGKSLIIVSISILLAYIVTEVLCPFIMGNGQTIGKRIFNLAVMQTDHTKIKKISVVVRAVLGKYTIETMIPVLICLMLMFNVIGWIGLVILVILLFLQLAVLINTKTNSVIHDLMACTVVVDMASQKIFDDTESMEEFKKKYEEKMNEKRNV